MPNKLYRELATLVTAIHNCERSGNTEWELKHTERLEELCKNYLPSGSGFDNGTHVDVKMCAADKLQLHAGYHRMDENGMYDGWLDLKIVIRPAFNDFRLRVYGIQVNSDPGLREYVEDVFGEALMVDVPYAYEVEQRAIDEMVAPVIAWVEDAETGESKECGPFLMRHDMVEKLSSFLLHHVSVRSRDLNPAVRASETLTTTLVDLVQPF